MTPERWRRITHVFHVARACDIAGRAALLDDACRDDLELRSEVEAMLAADHAAGQFGDTPMTAVETPRLASGKRLGTYGIDGLIGSGGMGQVYRAHDARLDRDVAIKVLTTSQDADARLRLLQEARAAAALNHPHVCTIHDVGEADGHAYIAMELIEGKSLDQLIPAGGLRVDDILRYGWQIADAIAHAHDRGIVHRDLKPANVMVADSGIAKVLDFGVAKGLPLPDQSHLEVAASRSVAGLVVGTVAYMAPEQARACGTDERSDVFSFGALLYEMATGRPAFSGTTPMEVMDAVLHAIPEPLGSVRRDLPAGLCRVIEKALRKESSQRYQHMSELAQDLLRLARPASRAWAQSAAVAAAALFTAALMWLGIPFVRRAPDSAATAISVPDVTAGKTRIAVLPFENLTRHPDDDWLASALSDSLTFGLESLDSLIPVSRNGIAHVYREHGLREADRLEPEAIARVSRALRIRYYISGSYQRFGNRVRVGARLIDVESGATTVQESITGRVDDLLQIEDALARTFVVGLEPRRTPAQRRPGTTSLPAHRALTETRGLYAAARWLPALESARRAVDLDPEHAEAWALLGKSYARVAAPSNFMGGPLEEYRALARAAAKRAVELDASSYEAHVALALAHRESSQYEPWRAAARKAISINPRFSEAYALLADSYSETSAWGCPPDGNIELAISSYRNALQIDPTVYAYYANLGGTLLNAGRPEEALQVAGEHARLYPTNGAGKRGRVLPLIELGRIDEAERALREAVPDLGPRVQNHRDLAIIDLRRGRLEAAASGFEKAIALRGHGWRPFIARQYIKVGLIKPAVDHLEETFRAEPACAQWLLRTKSPYWAVIRSNPETRALLDQYSAR